MPSLHPLPRVLASLVAPLAGALVLSSACAPDDAVEDACDGETDDLVFGHGTPRAGQPLTVDGRWHIPAATMAVGDTQDVDYQAAPPYDGGDNCSGSATDGALLLRDELLQYFPQIDAIGIYNCRVIAGTNSMSLHGVGRALDIMIPTIGGDADNGAGDPIGNWLIENAEAIGIQTIIWDHTIWRVTYDPREHALNGGNPHVDHLHVEISPSAANLNRPWYDAPFGPGPAIPCDPLPGAGGVVDEDGPCFDLHGPGQYWRSESGVGEGGGLLWTNAFENDTPSNWAEWKVPVSESGTYDVEVFLDPAHAQFAHTRYEVDTGDATHVVEVDQGAASGWTALGAFTLATGADARVKVFDHSAVAVGAQKRIAVDALRLTRVTAAPSEGEGEGEGEGEPPPAGDPPPEDEPPPDAEPETPDDDAPAEEDGPVLDADEPLQPDFAPSVEEHGPSCAAGGVPSVLAVLALWPLLGARRRRR